MSKWNIFVITHKHIFDQMYAKDSSFNEEQYKFVNVSGSNLDEFYRQKYHVINLYEIDDYTRLGANYVESEAIYNIYKNKKYYRHLDYIGFIHYDKELRLQNQESNITDQINSYVNDKIKSHISFGTYDMTTIYNQNVLADETKPGNIVGHGLNCIDYILNDYNSYFGTNHTLEALFNRKRINLESSFLIDIRTYQKMMGFCSSIIESKKLDVFDPLRRHRIQGGLLERYYGVFLALEYDEFLDLSLIHHAGLKYYFLRAPKHQTN